MVSMVGRIWSTVADRGIVKMVTRQFHYSGAYMHTQSFYARSTAGPSVYYSARIHKSRAKSP